MQEQDKLFRRFPLIAAVGLVVLTVAACAVQLRRDEGTQPSVSTESSESDHPLAPKLESCLTVTPDQTAIFEYCRRVWAENRRRFFGPTKKSLPSGAVGRASDQSSSETGPKDQSRLPQGYPSIATPEQE
ncbi:putative entry exclusion protein TrbK-alt [Bradyrhizobium sp. AZCC 2289]|uniref:putative entry exclusion protein TrbK-alt n=1 Tax=Bradyrhizobium sp. AZCC 2289 TaxID=3117026 RepID=UPI003FA5B034